MTSNFSNLYSFFLLITLFSSVFCAQISSILPQQGGINGGTYVTITGQGFDRDGEDGTTTVYIGNDICTTIEYYSSDSQIVCISPECTTDDCSIDGSDNLNLIIVLISISSASFANCLTSCIFYYRYYFDPYISTLTLSGSAGDLISYYGYLRATSIDDQYPFIGDYFCDLGSDNSINSDPLMNSWTYTATAYCEVQEQEAGIYNFSLRSFDSSYGFGYSGYNVDLYYNRIETGETYMFIQYPTITSIYPTKMGHLGGSPVTITGTGFSETTSNNVVQVGGVDCSILSASLNEIICIPDESDANETVTYIGGGGLKVEIWRGITSYSTTSFDGDVDEVTQTYNGTYLSLNEDYYADRMTGYFKPPVSGNYSFYIAGDDFGEFSISTDESSSNLRVVANNYYYSPTFWTRDGQISDPIWLDAGKRYFVQVRHMEWAGSDWIKVAARIMNSSHLQSSEEQKTYTTLTQQQSISISCSIIREIQRLTITGATSGYYALKANDKTSSVLTFDASLDDVTKALTSIYSDCTTLTVVMSNSSEIDSATSTKYIKRIYDITFNCPTTSAYSLLSVKNYNLYSSVGLLSYETKRVQNATEAINGAFQLGFEGEWTTDLSCSSSAWTVDTALETLTTISNVEVYKSTTTSFTGDGCTFLVNFNDPSGSLPLIQVNTTQLHATDLNVTVKEIHAGSDDVFLNPIPGFYFELPSNFSSVEVWSNSIKATCPCAPGLSCSKWDINNQTQGKCIFEFSDAITPTISLVQPSQVYPGAQLTIVGSNFASYNSSSQLSSSSDSSSSSYFTNGDNMIYFTNATNNITTSLTSSCNMTFANSSHIICTVGNIQWGILLTNVLVKNNGFARRVSNDVSITVLMNISSVSPLSGGVNGGNTIVISGEAFRGTNSIVKIDNSDCEITKASATTIQCLAPEAPCFSTNNILSSSSNSTWCASKISVDNYNFSQNYFFSANLTPTVDFFNPTMASTAITTTFYIWGSGFNNDTSTTIEINGIDCTLKSISYTNITCQLTRTSGSETFSVYPQINVPNRGYATIDDVIYLGFNIQSIEPSTGSWGGGQVIGISGFGFDSSNVENHVITMTRMDGETDDNSYECTPISASISLLYCRAPFIEFSSRSSSLTSLKFNLTVTLNGITTLCNGDCSYTFSDDFTPQIFSISPEMSPPDKSLTVTGTKFSHSTTIFIDGVNATLEQYINATTVIISSPTLTTGYRDVISFIPAYGYSGFLSSQIDSDGSLENVKFFMPLKILSLSRNAGSLAGGLGIIITGYGFGDTNSENLVYLNHSLNYNSSNNNLDGSIYNTEYLGIVEADVIYSSNASMIILTPSLSDSLSIENLLSQVTKSDDSSSNNGAIFVVFDVFTSVIEQNETSNTLNNSFVYSTALTPLISSISPGDGFMGDTVTITGNGFPNSYVSIDQNETMIVNIAGSYCFITNETEYSNASFTCEIGNVPAGTHVVNLTVTNKGRAFDDDTTHIEFESHLLVNSVSQKLGSIGGGTVLTISGKGFGRSATESSITLCDQECNIKSSMYDTIICQTQEMLTVSALSFLNYKSSSVLSGFTISGYGSSSSYYANAFDGDYTTYALSYYSYRSNCYVQVDFGENWLAQLTRIRFYPRLRYSSYMKGGYFTSSIDGATFEVLSKISSLHEGWNYIDFPSDTFTRYVRYYGPSSGYCYVTELEYQGFIVRTSDACNISAEISVISEYDDSTSSTVASNLTFQYDISKTPIVRSVNPWYGTAMGGTIVTIVGERFLSGIDNVTVTLNQMTCTPIFANETVVLCETSPRDALYDTSLVLQFNSTGLAVYNSSISLFEYLDRWSSLTTWSNYEPPIEGDSVIVPEGQSVLMDVTPPQLYLVLVLGKMVFDRADLALDATYIFIYGGIFQVGTEDYPFEDTATITLHGDRYSTLEIEDAGGKVLAVTNVGAMSDMVENGAVIPDNEVGYLDLHGKGRIRTWTKLNATAPAGTYIITTMNDVDFEPGDYLVVTSSTTNYLESEKVQVAELVSSRTIRLVNPLTYTHESMVVTIAGEEIDLTCEVGLLSRNIIVQGNSGSSSRQLYGVHTVAVHGGVYRLENTEFRRCGQAFNLGRYCTHTHMTGDNEASYVRMNSIHSSFQRACTTHGTNHMRVMHNVAYDIAGHAYFVEDGIEMYNILEENLGAKVHKSAALLKSDLMPAVFWTSGPTNMWRHNVAAGSANNGYWFELPTNPGGPSYTTSVCPVHSALLEFLNNSAHSNSVFGLRIYPIWTPLVDPCDSSSNPDPQYFYNLTSYRNGNHGVFVKKGGDLHHINYKLVENANYEFDWRFLTSIKFYKNNPFIKGMLAVKTLDPEKVSSVSGKRAIWAPQDEFFHVSQSKFVNYGTSGAIAGCNSCESDDELNQGGNTYRFDSLEFINTTRRTFWTGPYKQIFFDLDGSLTGQVLGTVMPYYAFNHWPECNKTDITYDYGLICNSSVRVRKLEVDYVEPWEMDFKTMIISSGMGNGSIEFITKEIYGWTIPLVNQHWYHIDWDTLIDVESFDLRYSEPEYISWDGNDEWMGSWFDYIDYRYEFEVKYNDVRRRVLWDRLPQPSDGFGVGTTNHTEKKWNVMMSTKNISYNATEPFGVSVYAIQCAPGKCNVPDVINIRNVSFWSDPDTWSGGQLPQEGDNVIINSTQLVILDINPPILNTLTINGKLQFLNSTSITLEAYNIAVWGILQIGSKDDPYVHDANIILHGNRYSSTLIVDNDLFLGNKVVGVFGELITYGKLRNVTWTRLSATANVGDITITVDDVVDWNIGEKIVISPTEYFSTVGGVNEEQTEYAEIKNINGRSIILSSELNYTHWAEKFTINGETVELKAAVGLFDRNIKFTSNFSENSEKYGTHIYVAKVTSGDISFNGKLDMHYTQFHQMGKFEMGYASIGFEYSSESLSSTISGCSFTENYNYGIEGEGVSGLILHNNLFAGNYRSAIQIDDDSSDISISDNLIVSVRWSPDETTSWVKPIAGIFVEGAISLLSGNLVAGSDDGGFTFYPESCDVSIENSKFKNNEAHACKVGIFLLSKQESSLCVQFSSATIWKSAHIGLLTMDMLNTMTLSNLILADNHIGMSLNFIHTMEGSVTLSDSIIIGSSSASSCSESNVCRADIKSDTTGKSCGSIFGSSYRRIGIITPQYTNRGKTCDHGEGTIQVCRPSNLPEKLCGMPWENKFGLPSVKYASFNITNTVFKNFNTSDCGLISKAFVPNPTQIDYSPEIFMKGITWDNTPDHARFAFIRTSSTKSECSSYSDYCDGLNIIIIHDVDGSIMGTAGGTLLSENPTLAAESPYCTTISDWRGYYCTGLSYNGALFENIDKDRGTRIIGPIKLTRYGPGSDSRTYWSQGPVDDGCAKRFYFGSYPLAISPGFKYDMEATATLPANLRIHWYNDNPDESALIQLRVTKGNLINVFVGDTYVTPSTKVPTMNDQAGANLLQYKNFTFYLTLRGGTDHIYTLRQIPVLQVTLHLDLPIADFFSADFVSNLALFLGIPSSRIKVVDVRTGSVYVDFYIYPTNTIVNDDSNVTSQYSELTNISTTLVDSALNNSLDIGYTVVGMSVIVPSLGDSTGNATSTSDDDTNIIEIILDPNFTEDDDNTGPIISSVFKDFMIVSICIVGFVILIICTTFCASNASFVKEIQPIAAAAIELKENKYEELPRDDEFNKQEKSKMILLDSEVIMSDDNFIKGKQLPRQELFQRVNLFEEMEQFTPNQFDQLSLDVIDKYWNPAAFPNNGDLEDNDANIDYVNAQHSSSLGLTTNWLDIGLSRQMTVSTSSEIGTREARIEKLEQQHHQQISNQNNNSKNENKNKTNNNQTKQPYDERNFRSQVEIDENLFLSSVSTNKQRSSSFG